MSSTTSGDLQLTKPAYTDPADIADINANMDAIDTAVSDLNSKTLKPITVSVDSLTNASGSYNHTTSNLTLVTEDMKAIDIEVGTPETFKAPVTVTTGNHTINISCPSVSGSSTVKVTLIHTQPVEGGQNVPSSITSTEFDILAGRIGTLSALQTSVKTDTVSAINSLSEQIGNINAIEITASGADESAMMANAVSQISQFSGTRAFSITWTNNNVGFLLYNYDKRRVLLDTGNAIFAGVVSSNRSSVTLNELALSSKLLKYVDVEFSNESVTQEGNIWYCSKNLTSVIGSGKTLVSASFISGTMFGVIPSLNHYTNALYIQKLSSGAYSGKIRVFYTD